MYPTAQMPWYGIFVKEQIEALVRNFTDIEAEVFYIRGNESRLNYLRDIPVLRRKIRQGGYDLVHVHYGPSGLFLLCGKPDIPVVVTLHGGDIQPEQGKSVQVALTHRILRRCDTAIALNDRMSAMARACCSDVLQIPCSVNPSVFCPGEPRKPMAGRRHFTILFPNSRTRIVKNYPLFCETVERLRTQHGLEIDTLELANMSRQEIAAAMQRADMMLMTSISEGSPQTVKEAMGCNLPVVSTPVGDVGVLLDGVRDSAVAPSHDSTALADSVMSVIRGEIKGKDPRERLMELGLDDDHTAARIYEIYKFLQSK